MGELSFNVEAQRHGEFNAKAQSGEDAKRF